VRFIRKKPKPPEQPVNPAEGMCLYVTNTGAYIRTTVGQLTVRLPRGDTKVVLYDEEYNLLWSGLITLKYE
jgi:hypothetical protein